MDNKWLREVLNRLRAQGSELQRYEVKGAQQDLPKSILSTAVAFANQERGGTILLGIGDAPHFKLLGVSNPDDFQSRLCNLLSDRLYPVPAFSVKAVIHQGKTVLVVEVQELPYYQKPCFDKKYGLHSGAYKRVGDQDRLLSPYEIFVLQSNAKVVQDDIRITDVPLYLNETLSDYAKSVKKTSRSDYLQKLTVEEVLEARKIMSQGKYTLMGLLTFHPYPQQYYPKLRITFTSHPASDSSPKDQAVRYLDNKVFEGPIEEVISDAIKYLIQQLPERLAVTTLRNRKQPEIPEIVLRELILNAVVHRDYSPMVQNREIRIRLFPDRVVIHNPGGLFGGIRIETIKTHNSVSRNPHFATLLEDIGLIENRGDGIATVLAECQDAGLREPHFVDLIDSFEVTVFRGSSTIQSDTQYEQITCKDLESFLIKHKEFCRSDLIAALDLTPGQAKYEILKLKRDNKIKQFGAGRGAKYRVLEKALPEGSKIL